MTSLERGVQPHIPERSEPAHKFDRLRPEFMHHVMSPFSHAAVARTVDSSRDLFLERVRDVPEIRTTAGQWGSYEIGDTTYRPERHAATAVEVLSGEFKSMFTNLEDMDVYPTFDLLTPRQRTAAKRCLSFSDSKGPLFQTSFFTVNNIVQQIYLRHPELQLHDTGHMLSFLRDDRTPGILRGFASGGFGFIANLIGDNTHPAGSSWHENPQKPVLDTSGEHPRTSKEILDVAHLHRTMNASMPEGELYDNDVFEVFLRYSAGCPARFLTFRTDIKDLMDHDLNLSPIQLKDLMDGDRPMIKQTDTHNYRVLRDSHAIVLNTLADGLEILGSK